MGNRGGQLGETENECYSPKSLESVSNPWRGSSLPLECVALTKIGDCYQVFGAAAQPNASKLARHKGRHD
jgi:hypothetical protein